MAGVEQLEVKLRAAMAHRTEPATIVAVAVWLRKLHKSTGKLSWDKKDILKFLDNLVESDAKPNTVRTAFAAIKMIHTYLDMSWPDIRPRELPRQLPQKVHRPYLTLDEVKEMVDWAKSDGDPVERALLSMSSVYGLRRVELSRLDRKSFDYPKVFIATAKHGLPREHLIADPIWPYIEPAIRYLPIQSVTSLSFLYNRMCDRMGKARQDAEGWHSIRRTLASELVMAGFSELEIAHFMRWSAGRNSMVSLYSQSLRLDDSRIFAKHSILEFWK